MADWKRPFFATASTGPMDIEYEKGDWRLGKSDQYTVTGSKDVTAIIELNKAEYNDGDHSNKRVGNKFGRHAARLDPALLPLLYDLDIVERGTAWKIKDMRRFEAWLDDPDNRCWRTWPGKIGHMTTSNQGKTPSEAK